MALGISMIMLTADAPIRAKDVQQQLRTNWPDLPEIKNIEEKDGSVAMQIGDADLIMAKMPAPIPWSDLEGPCATSVLWRNATAEVKQHKLHWIITVSGELEPLPLSILLTQATAASVAACSTAIGVYWGNATLVIPKKIYLDFCQGSPTSWSTVACVGRFSRRQEHRK